MSRTFSREETRRLVAILANAAQAEVLPRFRNLQPEAIRAKTSPHDLVTDADEAAERYIAARLNKLYPGSVFIGEEATALNPSLPNMLVDADLAFLVDPIDGTRNYVAGLPLFGMMLAVCHKGDVIAAVIYDPITRDAALAVRDAGAWMEREGKSPQPLKVAAAAAPMDMQIMVSDNGLPPAQRAMLHANLARLGNSGSLRCAAHEYRSAASGFCHVLLYSSLMPWDHAPGWLLHREAGGYSAHLDGSPYKPTHRTGGLLVAPDAASWHAAKRALLEKHEN